MHIAVVLRLMTNPGDGVRRGPAGADTDRARGEMVVSEFDDEALEEAVLIKEATGAHVTAFGLKAEGMDQALRTARARGADRAVLVDAGDIDPYDTRAEARALAQAAQSLVPDLVLTGVQTPTDLFGHTPPYLAAILGWPHANVVVDVRPARRGVQVTQQLAGDRLAVLRLALPAVVGIRSAGARPGEVSMTRVRPTTGEASPETMSVLAGRADLTGSAGAQLSVVSREALTLQR